MQRQPRGLVSAALAEAWEDGSRAVGCKVPSSMVLHAMADEHAKRTACGRVIPGYWRLWLFWDPYEPIDSTGWAGGLKPCLKCRRTWLRSLYSGQLDL